MEIALTPHTIHNMDEDEEEEVTILKEVEVPLEDDVSFIAEIPHANGQDQPPQTMTVTIPAMFPPMSTQLPTTVPTPAASTPMVVSTSASPVVHPTHAGVTLKQKEEIAKAAFKSWFIVKPGHREIKDHWWALYYKKLLPKYHLRDNFLGKLVNEWIKEESKALNIPVVEIKADQSEDEKDSGGKKRKAPCVKNNGFHAYNNLMLVHPPKITSDVSSLPEHVRKLVSCCKDGDIDWCTESLDEDLNWFRTNRQQIMDSIPPYHPTKAKTKKQKPDDKLETKSPKKEREIRETKSDKKSDISPENFSVQMKCSPVLPYDLYRSAEGYTLHVDLPGVVSERDYLVQTDDISLVIVKGQRRITRERSEPSTFHKISVSRTFGDFKIEMTVPPIADLNHTVHSYVNGVLALKVPFKSAPTNSAPPSNHIVVDNAMAQT